MPAGLLTRAAVVAAVLIALGAFAVRLCLTVPGNSVTYDESVHVTRGYAALKYHDLRLNVEHPVLGDAIAALPLLADPDIRFPDKSFAWESAAHWVVADLFLWHDNLNPQQLVDRARYVVVGLSVLLGLLVFFWAAELYGWKGGLLSLLLYTVCPNILANSSLATNDLSLTLFSTLFLYALWKFLQKPCLVRGAMAAICLGAAVMCKYSGLVLLLDTVLIMGWWWYRNNRKPTAPAHEEEAATEAGSPSRISETRCAPAPGFWVCVGQCVAIFAGAALLVWLVYGAKFRPLLTPAVMQQEIHQSLDQFIRKHQVRPDTQLIKDPDEVNKQPPPLPHNLRYRLLTKAPMPAPQYVRGLLENYMQARGGHRAYLMGRMSRNGWWYFFPVAFLMKTPIPFLIFILLAVAAIRMRWEWDESLLLLPAAVLFAVAMKAHIDIGIRHLLPIYPLLAIFCGRLFAVIRQIRTSAGGAQPSTDTCRHWTLGGTILIGLLCCWSVFETARVHPLYLTYFNEIAGGPEGGHRFLVDSNLDWGQDLIRLHRALKQHHLGTIGLAYFGTAEPNAYGIDYIPLDTKPLVPLPAGEPPFYGWAAVSVTDLAYYGGPGEGLAWVHRYRPQFEVGHTFLVYHMSAPRVQRPGAKKPGVRVPVNWP